jgi:hypothetical protein
MVAELIELGLLADGAVAFSAYSQITEGCFWDLELAKDVVDG